ncbi:CheC, inhibitor of MCP methylation [Acetoanaerobium sticklandii]|uniref:CheC, inhibitor of MCP methylation n=1 Tax=Acetoanaerobium sticklandii (strain ATCC 12662 / DSM 519 / JCM 1433 / CCUG 9281 / NCIMB 10654 / HF) TaxID=499177 RepID=E3PV46_ACESD|nr:chemotaxis protein CheC [Acetoanaerobium sticklandii]CBH22499.1 CheC, inhibitor of MCP methylation [Acetoanaerobium sticklandii]
MINELQKDLLKEYINVFIGQAANMLSEMANQRVLLSVPEVEIVNMAEDEVLSSELFSHGHIVSSSMKFGNDFSGRAMLIFPAKKAKLLVDACMGMESEKIQDEEFHLIDTDFDVLKEISNVILNSVIGEFSNLLDTTVEFSIPDVELLFVSENEQKMYLKHDIYMLMLYTSFQLAEAEVEGVVIVALGMNSLNKLIDKINEILGEM